MNKRIALEHSGYGKRPVMQAKLALGYGYAIRHCMNTKFLIENSLLALKFPGGYPDCAYEIFLFRCSANPDYQKKKTLIRPGQLPF